MRLWVGFAMLALVAGPGPLARALADTEWLGEARPLIELVSLPKPGTPPVSEHAKRFAELVARTRSRWVDPARAFFPGIVPKGLPPRVVYPFGGGDLVGALATYPEATEITTLSLEPAGDVRVFSAARGLSRTDKALEPLLAKFRDAFRWFLYNAHSKTTVMGSISGRAVPGQLLFWFAELAMLDYEPVSLKYFKLAPDGAPVYQTREAGGDERFDNAELQFRKRGDAAAPVITYRHLRANLDDTHWKQRADLRAHLAAKGRISAMTKAASFLLWSSEFSGIRDYLLANADFMVSDATGIPPRLAGPAGFTQTTYGRFAGPCLSAGQTDSDAFRKLWASQPQRPLPFRYGYPDAKRQNHMMTMSRR